MPIFHNSVGAKHEVERAQKRHKEGLFEEKCVREGTEKNGNVALASRRETQFHLSEASKIDREKNTKNTHLAFY